MSYSYTRFRRVLAVVRILVGLIFVISGGIKLFDPSFFASGFMAALSRMSTTTVGWYLPIVHNLFNHPGWFAVLVGAIELFLGIALSLGLATRPASFLGVLYMLNRMAITWYPGGSNPSLYQYMDVHVQQFTMMCLFLLFAVGHAGETWGLGAIYHNQRFEKRQSSLRDHPEYSYLYEPETEEAQPAEATARSSES
jgi:uncharacterized membrane protein YphA (DoxX/SURF4 family)